MHACLELFLPAAYAVAVAAAALAAFYMLYGDMCLSIYGDKVRKGAKTVTVDGCGVVLRQWNAKRHQTYC